MEKELICSYCGKQIEKKRTRKQIESYKHFFCSRDCERNYRIQNRKPNAICSVCGKPYHVKPYELVTTKYCSRECQNEARKDYMRGSGNHQYGIKGEMNASWKGGRRISAYGYILVFNPDHPFANVNGYVFEHRMIAEKYLLNDKNSIIIDGKKYLSEEYCVHHIDFNRQNNELNNLIVMSNKEHMSLHSRLRKHEIERINYAEKYGVDISERFMRKDESKIG